MAKLKFRLMPKGTGVKTGLPIHLALVDIKDVEKAGLDAKAAAEKIAAEVKEPIAINFFNLDAVTTSSDGLLVRGAPKAFAAGDYGKIHPEFGFLYCKPRKVTEEMLDFEPHLRQIFDKCPEKELMCGPDEAEKLIPLHNAVMTGRAVNNNSGTEVMNSVTMEEMLIPIMGQLELIQGREVLLGLCGGVVSAALAHVVTENFSRSQPRLRCNPGDTIHRSGEHAPKLKAHLPIMVAPKKVLAAYIIEALEAGMVPAREISSAPDVLLVAHALGYTIIWDNITVEAKKELKAINVDPDVLRNTPSPKLTKEQVIEKADEIIPGIEQARLVKADEISKVITIEV